jgi:DNA topoisomerase-2
MWSLTLERKQELLKQRDVKLQEVKDLEKKTPPDLWNDDLDNLLTVVRIYVFSLMTCQCGEYFP